MLRWNKNLPGTQLQLAALQLGGAGALNECRPERSADQQTEWPKDLRRMSVHIFAGGQGQSWPGKAQ